MHQVPQARGRAWKFGLHTGSPAYRQPARRDLVAAAIWSKIAVPMACVHTSYYGSLDTESTGLWVVRVVRCALLLKCLFALQVPHYRRQTLRERRRSGPAGLS